MSTSNVIQLPRPEQRARAEPVAVLDVGTSKMCCLIARRRGDRLELQGGGYQLAEGLRAGVIVDAEAAEASILAVVHEAEQQAGRTVREIVLGISGGRLESVVKPSISTWAVARSLRRTSAMLWRSPGAGARRRARGSARPAGGDHAGRQPAPARRARHGRPAPAHRGAPGAGGGAALHTLLAAIERCHLDVAAVIAAPPPASPA